MLDDLDLCCCQMPIGEGWGAGFEWIVDAFDCDPERLRSQETLGIVFAKVIVDLGLKPLTPPVFHGFDGHGGVTGFVMLSESHLSCHTFPENAFAAFDLFCCRPRPDWDWDAELSSALGARKVTVRRLARGVASEEEGRS